LKAAGTWDENFAAEDTEDTGSVDKSASGSDSKMLTVRKQTMIFDMTEENLMRIMKTGARMTRYTKKKSADKKIILNEDEDELVCGNKRSTALDFLGGLRFCADWGGVW